MRQLEDYLDLDTLVELRPRDVGDFCEGAMDADILIEELEEYGPFAPIRKWFCEFVGIGESTLTGWLKAERVPRAAKVAYVLTIVMTELQAEVKRLRQNEHDFKIVQDGETFQVVKFEADETGVAVGTIVARDIPNAKAARVLAGSVQAFRMLQETRNVIIEMLERTENAQYTDYLSDLNTRILKGTLAAFEPEKWRKLFGPFDIDLDVGDLLDELGRRQESVETVEPNTAVESEPNTAVESASNSGDQNDTGASSKRD